MQDNLDRQPDTRYLELRLQSFKPNLCWVKRNFIYNEIKIRNVLSLAQCALGSTMDNSGMYFICGNKNAAYPAVQFGKKTSTNNITISAQCHEATIR